MKFRDQIIRVFAAASAAAMLICPLSACSSDKEGNDSKKTDTAAQRGEDENPVKSYGVTVSDTAAYTAPLRAQYHYSTHNSWINDPNGLVYFNGVWHMYYQTNPGKNYWGNMTWGHAVSDDLVHWVEKEPALLPDKDGTMFSGTSYADLTNRSGFFEKTGSGIISAYSTDTQHVGIAYSEDGYSFTKLGIVIKNPGVADFRDPKLFWHEESGKWIIVVAGGTLRIYSSDDLRSWRLMSTGTINTECPDLFPLTVEGSNGEEVKWILTCSSRGYYIGSFDGIKFTPESDYIEMNEGPDSYAGIIFSNATKNRTIMINWFQNFAYSTPADGIWNGYMSLPVEIKLKNIEDVGLRLTQLPAEEVSLLDTKAYTTLLQASITKGNDPLEKINSNTFRLDLEFDVTKTSDFTLKVCESESEAVTLSYKKSRMSFTFDRSGLVNSLEAMKSMGKYTFSVPSGALEDNILKLSVYVDVSTFEMFVADGLYYFSARIQPFSGSRGMSLTSQGTLAVNKLSVTALSSIWFGTEPADYLHLDKSALTVYTSGDQSVYLRSDLVSKEEGAEITWSVGDGDIVALSNIVAQKYSGEEGVQITPLKGGKTVITASCGKLKASCSVNVIDNEGSEFSSMLGNYKMTNGTVEETPLGYHIKSNGSGDSFLLSEKLVRDFTYSADILHESSNGASALIFRASDTNNFYCVNIDVAAKCVKLWKKTAGSGKELKVYNTAVACGISYRLEVSVTGSSISVSLDGKLLFTVNDSSFASGVLGLNEFNGSGYINNVTYTSKDDENGRADSDELGTLDIKSGLFTETSSGYLFTNTGDDNFVFTSVSANAVSFSADIRLLTDSGAASLLFGARNTENFFCANIDAGGRVIKLWKRVNNVTTVIKTVAFTPVPGTVYNLGIIHTADGGITVTVNGEAKIQVNDADCGEGMLGFNTFRAGAYFNRIRYTIG